MTEKPTLADRMDELAKTHPRGDELRRKAAALRESTEGFWGEPQTVSAEDFLNRWAQARLLWCRVTGEPLV